MSEMIGIHPIAIRRIIARLSEAGIVKMQRGFGHSSQMIRYRHSVTLLGIHSTWICQVTLSRDRRDDSRCADATFAPLLFLKQSGNAGGSPPMPLPRVSRIVAM
jgi:DNA-binding IscR family transcriptional regulator